MPGKNLALTNILQCYGGFMGTGLKGVDEAGPQEERKEMTADGHWWDLGWDLETGIVNSTGGITEGPLLHFQRSQLLDLIHLNGMVLRVMNSEQVKLSLYSRLHECPRRINPLLFSNDMSSTVGNSYNVGIEL